MSNNIQTIYNNRYNTGYNNGRVQGQNDVRNNPNGYGFYTGAQYNQNYTNGYNAGVAAAKPYRHPSRVHWMGGWDAGINNQGGKRISNFDIYIIVGILMEGRRINWQSFSMTNTTLIYMKGDTQEGNNFLAWGIFSANNRGECVLTQSTNTWTGGVALAWD